MGPHAGVRGWLGLCRVLICPFISYGRRVQASTRPEESGAPPDVAEPGSSKPMKSYKPAPARIQAALRTAGSVFREAGREWKSDNIPESAAALAFYTILSLAPLLIILIALAGVYLEPRVAQGRVLDQLADVVGQEGAGLIRNLLRDAYERTAAATVFSIATILVGATIVFSELHRVLNRIWGVRPERSMKAFGKKRLMTFVMVLAAGLLLFLVLTVSTFVSAATSVLFTLGKSFIALYVGSGIIRSS